MLNKQDQAKQDLLVDATFIFNNDNPKYERMWIVDKRVCYSKPTEAVRLIVKELDGDHRQGMFVVNVPLGSVEFIGWDH